MKTLLSFLICILFVPQHDTDKIPWEQNKKLGWEDFQGTPHQGASFVASTNTGIQFGYSYSIDREEVKIRYEVSSFFNTQKSWFIPGKVTPYILSHEQTHFDISELHARILRKRLEQKKFSKNVKAEIEAIYRQVEQQRKTMQRKYDAQSDHSRKEKEELKWQKYIARQLTAHDDWK